MTCAADANPSIAKLLPRKVRLRKSPKSTIGRFCISSAAT
jgi:hypothetical protein